ncbi:MAG: M28 family peptidase [Pirellulales bacterium]
MFGSAYYVHQPVFPLDKTVAMLNMDMVGRLKDEELILYGTGTAKQFDALATKINDREPFRFKIKREPGGFGPSDHSSFYAMKIPVYHFFTGLHNDYHRPSDDWEKLNIPGMRCIADMVYQTAVDIAATDEPPTYTEAPGEKFGKGTTEKKGARALFRQHPGFVQHRRRLPAVGHFEGKPGG